MEPPAAADITVDDPFFAPLRRRHPDVDLVLLPPERSPQVDPVGVGVVAAATDRAARVAGRLGQVAGLGDATGSRLGFGPDPGTVVATARLAAGSAADETVLDRLARAGAADGWEVRRRTGAVASLVGRHAGLRLRATYAAATRALLVEVASTPLTVGTARARDLVRGP